MFCDSGAEFTCMSVTSRTNEEEKLYQLEEDILPGKVKIPTNFELLYKDYVWVFDTGSTQNCSSSTRGAVNLRKQEEDSPITASGLHVD